MDDLGELARGIGAAAAYAGVGFCLLVLGFALVDALTPGKLRQQIWHDRDLNASILVVSALFSVGILVVVSIFVADTDLARGLIDAVAFGLLGIILFGISFKITDWLTPGDLGALLVEDRFHPAVLVTAVVNVTIAMILAVSFIP